MNFSSIKESIIKSCKNKSRYDLTKYIIITTAAILEFSLLLVFLNVFPQQITILNLKTTMDMFTFKFTLHILTYKISLFNINVNNELLNPSNFNEFLKVIIASLSTLLAIVFALSQFILTNIIDRYSMQIIEKYENSSKTRLFILYILIIVFSVFLWVTPNLSTFSPLAYLFGIILAIYFFIISFAYLVDYIEYMFNLINPLKFADVQKNDVVQAIRDQKEEDVKNGINAMGDITIKLMRRGEEKICLEYIDYIKNIFLEFMDLKPKNPKKYKIKAAPRVQGIKKNRNNVLDYILKEYDRIYRESLTLKQEDISEQISRNLYQIMYGVLYA